MINMMINRTTSSAMVDEIPPATSSCHSIIKPLHVRIIVVIRVYLHATTIAHRMVVVGG